MVAGLAQQMHKGIAARMERNAVVTHTMVTRQASGHQRGAIRHTHRIGHIEALKTQPARGNTIEMRGGEDGMAVTAQVISPVLVGHDEEKVVWRHKQHPLMAMWRHPYMP